MLAATGQASKGAWRRRCRRCDGLDRLARSTRDRRQACVARVPTAGEHSEHRRNPLRGGGRAYETEVRLLKPRRRGWDRRALRAGCRVVDRAVPSRQLNPRNRTHRPAGVASALGHNRPRAPFRYTGNRCSFVRPLPADVPKFPGMNAQRQCRRRTNESSWGITT